MAMRKRGWAKARQYSARASLVILAGLIVWSLAGNSHAAGLLDRSLALLNSNASTATSYSISFTIPSNSPVGSIRFLFCSNSPLEIDPCDAPSGFDASTATIGAQSGFGVMTIRSQDANSIVVGNDPTAVVPPKPVSFTFDGITNPDDIGSYYLRLFTFSSDDGTGSRVDYGGLAFAINNNVQITSEVPPFLAFCTGVTIGGFTCDTADGNYINLGILRPTQSSSATSEMLAATNAGDGYYVQVTGTTLTSGNNTIQAITSPDISRPGTSQFGINLRQNSDPAKGSEPSGPGTGAAVGDYTLADRFTFNSGDTVAQSLGADDFRKYSVTYLVNISSSQPGGIYASTLTYVATGNF
jgi:hypothetical protein